MLEKNKYDELLKKYPSVGAVMPSQVWEGIKRADQDTGDHLGDLWESNIKENAKHHIPKNGWINDGYVGIGRHKAVIAIGSGPSLKKNKDFLKTVSIADGTREFEEQDFILMSSNHQVKDCFETGIIPHFVMCADGAQELSKQFNVGKTGKYTTLIASVITHPDVIANWKGPVKFVCPKSDKVIEYVEKALDDKIDPERCVTAGGNILNFSFVLGLGLFRVSVWMCVGNDLSYAPSEDGKEGRREGFYEDGDYTTNIESQRDEASHEFEWGGFELQKSTIWTPGNHVIWKGQWLLTAPTLFYYKSWLEANAMIAWEHKGQFHIYNCTEGGILGVLLKEEANTRDKYDEKFDHDNWFLMDDVSKGRWRTRTLEFACEEFHDMKQKLLGRDKWQGSLIKSVAQNATNTGQKTIH